ncbi:aspartate aminotransferase family protein [Tardiphaga robiniae]|uniref:Aspartate aminotransferase family protein n=2 Tax=Tardiphaga robiniae TaxID=943830 RepID=A0A7G6U928_9BRAD|nr:aspartate aminotransferase family protein [Tardiphaga robiniae]QND75510.1 aspartate aminotransferase family protein [Tardiphaga robiniae]
MVNAFDPATASGLKESSRRLVERRTKLLGPAYRLFYNDPVEVSRAKGVLLFDAEGRDYLDAYNNVVSVGHCHPRVVDAISAQLRTVCTHTRYLQNEILDYAEDLLSTLGEPLQHVMFTCTGSEANDLAVRIAKHHTGKRGVIITDEAYHGNSDLTSGFSPSLGPYSPLGAFVRRIPTPDSYRLPSQGMGQWMAENVVAQVHDLERRGEGLAAFIVDSIFSSDGIFSNPIELLGPVCDAVHAAGGLFIADEVQSGFARTGEKLWGYQRHGVYPDIVTMGKPMGNGFPVAAVALSPNIVQEFGRDTRYFNTFGGNTVAVAAAQAVLNVIRDEGLLNNAARVGRIIQDGFVELAKHYEQIGDVRGAGLYIGVELVKSRATKEPDSATTLALVNGLRARRVLISATGFHANILKIRPPLVFSEDNADRLLSEAKAVFASL